MLKKRSTNIVLILVILLIAGAGISMVSVRQSSKEWREVRTRVMPQLVPYYNKEVVPVVTKKFSEHVDIGFVVDADSKYQFIDGELLASWGIDVDTLYDQAIRNLDARSRNIKVEVAEASDTDPTAKYVIVELDDGYAAARILSTGVRKAIARELGDEYVAAIPTRDFLIFWHKDFPLFDAFAKQVEAEYNAEETYKITATPFFVSRTGIEELVKKVQDEE
tara:strand:+ start:194 stop:856 length:663 start_codon:yes stop_codon:yes gene_type:complete